MTDFVPLRRVGTAFVEWESFSEDEDDEPDEGWYVSVELGDERSELEVSFTLGPDAMSGPGLGSIEEALQLVEKWAKDRGFVAHRPFISVAITTPPEERKL